MIIIIYLPHPDLRFTVIFAALLTAFTEKKLHIPVKLLFVDH